MVSVNGNYENKRNYYLFKELSAQITDVKEKDTQKVNEGKAEFVKECGAELLTAGVYTNAVNFVSKPAELDKETSSELAQLFAMAGISQKLPTAEEYARIAGNVKANIAKFDPFETEKHIETLFANEQLMDILAEETIL